MEKGLTHEQIDFRLDTFTLNNQFIYWLTRSKCMWSLKLTNEKYEDMRLTMDHGTAFESLKKKMFEFGIKD